MPQATQRKWKRSGGVIGLAMVTELGERFMKGHRKNPNYGSGLALEDDFKEFFGHYDGLKPVEQEAVRTYVAARLGTARRLTYRDVPGLKGPPKPSENGDAPPVVQGGRA